MNHKKYNFIILWVRLIKGDTTHIEYSQKVRVIQSNFVLGLGVYDWNVLEPVKCFIWSNNPVIYCSYYRIINLRYFG